MFTIEEARTVVCHYTGTLPDGSVFDTSRERSPLEVRISTGQIIPGFKSGVMSMKVGDTHTFTLSPEDAYGEHDEGLCHWVENERFAEPDGIEAGRMFRIPLGEGRSLQGTVIQVGEVDVLIDLNHPLAGKALTFEVECLDIRHE